MARIFSALAIFALLLLITNIVLGFTTGDYNGVTRQYIAKMKQLRGTPGVTPEQLKEKDPQYRELVEQFTAIEKRQVLHLLFGLAASLVTVLVNSITVTYFIGTSRWCKEVVDTYSLDADLADRSTALKRKTFPWALGAIGMILLIIFLGGAAQPIGANATNSANWVVPHYCSALLGTMLIGWSFFVQVGYIADNYKVIDDILTEVKRIRTERGLDDVLKD